VLVNADSDGSGLPASGSLSAAMAEDSYGDELPDIVGGSSRGTRNVVDALSYGWTATLGSSGDEAVAAVAVDDSGNVYLAGWYEGTVDFDPGVGTDARVSNGSRDIFVTRLGADGSYGWTWTAGGDLVDQAQDICVRGGYVHVTGVYQQTVDFAPGPAADEHTAVGSDDVFVTRLGILNTYEWTRTWGGSENDEGRGVAVDGSGNVYVVGSFGDHVDFDPGLGSEFETSEGLIDAFLSRFTSAGEHEWTYTAGSTLWDLAEDVVVDAADNVVVGGMFFSTVDFDPAWAGVDEHTSAGFYDSYVSKFNADGSYAWTRTFGGQDDDEALNSLALDDAGNVYLAGEFATTLHAVDFDPTAGTDERMAVGALDGFVMRLDANGDYGWTNTMGGTLAQARVRGVVVGPGNEVCLVGEFTGTVDFDPGAGTDELASVGQDDVFVSELNVAGAYVGTVAVGSISGDIGLAITMDGAGNAIYGGYYRAAMDFDPTAGSDLHYNYGGTDGFVTKLFGSAATGTISGLKWEDLDHDGVQDAGEPPLNGWTIFLDTDADNELDAGEVVAVTNLEGRYTFTDLPAGSYTVAEVIEDGWAQSLPGGPDYSWSVDIEPGEDSADWDFGNYQRFDFGDLPDPPYATELPDAARHRLVDGGPWLGAAVDAEPDGQPTAGADGDDIDGVNDDDGVTFLTDLVIGMDAQVRVNASAAGILSAWIDLDNDGVLEASEKVIDDEALAAGDNDLSFAVPGGLTPVDPAYARFRFSSAGGLGPDGEAADGEVEDYAVPLIKAGSVTGMKFHDLDADGVFDAGEPVLSGWTIYADLNDNGSLDGAEPSDVTNAAGEYRIDALPVGSVVLREVPQPGWFLSAPGAGYHDVSIVAGAVTGGADFGNYRQAAIGDFAWHDLDGDGEQDAGEAGLDGVTVSLLDGSTFAVLDVTTTAGGGFYEFTVDPGDYAVEFAPHAAGWYFSPQDAAGDAVDSDPDVVNGVTAAFSVASEDDAKTWDAGLWKPGTISGTKFQDDDGDGLQDPGEPGLANWTIYSDTDGDGALDPGEPNALTGATGGYTLTSLAPGTHTIREVMQPDYGQTAPAGGAHLVSLGSGDALSGYDFANQALRGLMVIDTYLYADGVRITFYDIDPSDGVDDPSIAWFPADFVPGATDILIMPGLIGDRITEQILFFGDGTETGDTGCTVSNSVRVTRLADMRAVLSPGIGFFATDGDVGVAELARPTQGADINGLFDPGGWGLRADIDGDGESDDLTGFYCGGTATRLFCSSGKTGDAVIDGDIAQIVCHKAFGDDLLVGGDLGSLQVFHEGLPALNGRVIVTGDSNTIAVFGETTADIDIAGRANTLQFFNDTAVAFSGNVDVGGAVLTFLARGDVNGDLTVAANVTGMMVASDLNGDVDVDGRANAVVVQGDLNGKVHVGDRADHVLVEGDVNGDLTIDGHAALVFVRGNLNGDTAIGDGTAMVFCNRVVSGALGIVGDAGRIVARGGITGPVDISGNSTFFLALGPIIDSDGDPLTPAVHISGDVTAFMVSGAGIRGDVVLGGRCRVFFTGALEGNLTVQDTLEGFVAMGDVIGSVRVVAGDLLRFGVVGGRLIGGDGDPLTPVVDVPGKMNGFSMTGYSGPEPNIIEGGTIVVGERLAALLVSGGDVDAALTAGAIQTAVFAEGSVTQPITTTGAAGTTGNLMLLLALRGSIAADVNVAGLGGVVVSRGGISGDMTFGTGLGSFASMGPVSGTITVATGDLTGFRVFLLGGGVAMDGARIEALDGSIGSGLVLGDTRDTHFGAPSGSIGFATFIGDVAGCELTAGADIWSVSVQGDYSNSSIVGRELRSVSVRDSVSGTPAGSHVIRALDGTSSFALGHGGFWDVINAGHNHVDVGGVECYVGV